jgi:hypothetical protein
MSKIIAFPFVCLGFLALLLGCAAGAAPASSPPVPAASMSMTHSAAPEDVATIDGVVDALYDVISGGVGQPRDWDRMRSLFHPAARMIATGPAPDGTQRMQAMDVEGYITGGGDMLVEIGFVEREIARTTERWGNMAHLFSTYEAFRGAETEPFLRGINSIQLWNDGNRWWILTILWEPETPDNPLPPRYLGETD